MTVRFFNILSTEDWLNTIRLASNGTERVFLRSLPDSVDDFKILILHGSDIKGDLNQFLAKFTGNMEYLTPLKTFQITVGMLVNAAHLNLSEVEKRALESVAQLITTFEPQCSTVDIPAMAFPDMSRPVQASRVRLNGEEINIFGHRMIFRVDPEQHNFPVGAPQLFQNSRAGRALQEIGAELRESFETLSHAFMAVLELKGPLFEVAEDYFGGTGRIPRTERDFVFNTINFCREVIENRLEDALEEIMKKQHSRDEFRSLLQQIFWGDDTQLKLAVAFQETRVIDVQEEDFIDEQKPGYAAAERRHFATIHELTPILYEAALEVFYVFGGSQECKKVIDQCVQNYEPESLKRRPDSE